MSSVSQCNGISLNVYQQKTLRDLILLFTSFRYISTVKLIIPQLQRVDFFIGYYGLLLYRLQNLRHLTIIY